MATIQHAIEVNAPVHTVYNQLMHFEEYPRFMDDVEQVSQIDDTHLRWTARMANRPVQWDAEITEQEPDRCLAWQATSGPMNAGKVEIAPLGPHAAKVVFTMQAEPGHFGGLGEGSEEGEMTQHLSQNLARFKQLVETQGSQTAFSRSAGDQAGDPNARQQDGSGSPQEFEQSETQNDEGAPAINSRKAAAAPVGASGMVGTFGGTDAAAGAHLSGSKHGGPGGTSLRESGDAAGVPGTPGGTMQGDATSPAAGAAAAGGTGLGSTADAGDMRSGTGSSSGSGTALTGGGMSGARDAGKGGAA